jgi:nucleoside-diphosphate-sugar epimerase
LTNRVLVTGASGFIGYHLVQTLVRRGERVRCLVRATSDVSKLPLDDIELIQGDVLDPDSLKPALEGVASVFHLAGYIDATKRTLLYRVNVDGVRNIAAACADQPEPPVLLYASSLEAGGPDIDGQPRTESQQPEPITHYGRSKYLGEQAATEFADKVPMTFVRASAVFGPYDRETFNVFKAFQLGGVGLYPLPGGNDIRLSLIHAHDLANFFILAAKTGERVEPNGPTGTGIYYAAYEDQPTFAEVIKLAADSLRYERIRVIEIPIIAIWVAGAFAELWARLSGKPAGILNLDKARAAATGSWICSTEKSVGLGFSPDYSLSERIRMTAHWYQKHGWL